MSRSSAFPHRLRRAALAVCIAVWSAAFVVTHVPGDSLPETGVSDESLHFVGFFVLASLLLGTLITFGLPPVRRIVLVLVAATLYAGIDETTQPAFGRSASFGDWLGDVGGAVAAVLTAELLMVAILAARRRRKKNA